MSRHITAVCTHGQGGRRYAVGYDGITAIHETVRYGQMSMVPWFVVEESGGTIIEINAAHVEYVTWSDHDTDDGKEPF